MSLSTLVRACHHSRRRPSSSISFFPSSLLFSSIYLYILHLPFSTSIPSLHPHSPSVTYSPPSMSSYSPHSTSSLRSTCTHPLSARSQTLPVPASRRLDVDVWDDNDNQEHDQDDDDYFLFGFSAKSMDASPPASQSTEDDEELPTPPDSLPDDTQVLVDSHRKGAFLQALPRSHALKPTDTCADPQPTPSVTLSSSSLSSSEPIVDEEDDGAFLQFLVQQQEQRRTAELVPLQLQPVVVEPLPPDRPRSNDPLELYFQLAQDGSDSAMGDEHSQ